MASRDTSQLNLGVRAPRRRRIDLAGLLELRLPFDPVLAAAAVALSLCSVAAVGAATNGSAEFMVRQAVYAGLGVAVAVLVSRVDYARLRDARWLVYGGMLVAILAVFLLGTETRGSVLAIQLPFFSFQGSELGKVLLVVFGAAFLVERARVVDRWQTTLTALALMTVPAVLVLSSDLGSGLVYGVITLAVLFMAGTPGRHIAAIVAAVLAAAVLALGALPAVGVDVLKPYQEARLTAFLNPSADPAQAGYNVDQAKIAVGAGRKVGRGDEATQTKLAFLPEAQTDFIFATIGERWGFAGAAAVLSLYALIMWRGLRILSLARDFFGAVIAAGILAMLLFQVLQNAGMNVGIMPITGIPLPLVSYGGSSVLSTYLAIGLLQAIYAQGRTSTRPGPIART